MTQGMNEQLILITGESASGKSASLQNIPGDERVLYLNCESGKRLPFRNKFTSMTITDPYHVFEAFEKTQKGGVLEDKFDVIIIDTLTFLMDMFESTYVLGAADTMKGWSNYQQFFKKLMQEHVAKSPKAVIFLAHTRADLDEAAMEMRTAVPIKGALKNNGIESYFSTVVSTKKVILKELEEQDPDLLHITPQDEALGYKHVFQTQLTAATKGERIRSPMGLFTMNQTYMDNDAARLLKHLHEYYK
jgi:hypothetical protein